MVARARVTRSSDNKYLNCSTALIYSSILRGGGRAIRIHLGLTCEEAGAAAVDSMAEETGAVEVTYMSAARTGSVPAAAAAAATEAAKSIAFGRTGASKGADASRISGAGACTAARG
jgi:hypothetical protein